MADIQLSKPQAGESQVIPSADGAKFIFDFPASDAAIARDGDNFVINFQDGSNLTIENFYTQYNNENLPSFELDGEEITAEQFFTAMNEPDLMPAAGPGTGTTSNGGRFHDFGNAALTTGIDHLTRLDWHTERSFEPETSDWITRPDDETPDWIARPDNETPDRVARPDNEGDDYEVRINHPVTLTPINPDQIPPDTPDLPPSGTDNPGENPGGFPSELALGRDVRQIRESDLDNGNKPSVDGAFKIDAPDGLATINVAGVDIWQNGVMNANARFDTDEGYFHNFAYNADTGILTYTYTLTSATQEHGTQGADNIAHSLPVSATDVDGDTALGMMTIVIEDDMPVINATVEAPKNVVETSVLIDFTGQNGSSLGSFQDLFANQDKAWNKDNFDAAEDKGDLFKSYDEANNQVHWVVVNGIKLIPTHVQYEIDGNGEYHIDNLIDNNAVVNGNAGHTSDKVLNLAPEGIGMGTTAEAAPGNVNWGKDQFGSDGKTGGIGQADAFVIEPANGSVWYQLDIDLSNFSNGDRAVIYFYLTPQNNNDDNIVHTVEITADNLDGKQTIQIPMPDGFTKAILAPIPKENGEASEFIVSKLNFSKNAYEHNGTIAVDPGADGAGADGGVTWNWDDMTNALDGKEVSIYETPGASKYTVHFQSSEDGMTIKAMLSGNEGGEFSLNGNPLFIAALNPADGTWKIDQFYKYSCDGVDIDKLQFTVTAKDADGDEVSTTVPVNMKLDHGLDRFDNVELGYYDKRPVADGGWGEQAVRDNAYDLLSGKAGNDLMYGRGGYDIMFGDDAEGTALSDLAKTLDKYDINNKFSPEEANKFQEITKTDSYKPGGDNELAHKELLNGLNDLRNTEADVKADYLNKFLDEFEKLEQPGGDDAMYGGLGRDILFGGAGDDYLVGNGDSDPNTPPNGTYEIKDQDMLFGGSGNDIIVFDPNDFIVHGGSGIDVLLAGNETNMKNGTAIGHLWEIQNNLNLDKAYVDSMEVLIRSEHTENVENLGITSHDALKNYGVDITGDSMTLSDAWTLVEPPHTVQNDHGQWVTYHTYTYKGANGEELTLETSLKPGTDGVFHPVKPSETSATDGNDVIIGNDEGTTINGGAGDDYIDGGKGKDSINAGDGNDVIIYDINDAEINGGNGIDLLLANANDLYGNKSTLRQLTVIDGNPVSSVEMMLINKNNNKDIKDLGITQDVLASYGIAIIGDNIYLDDSLWTAVKSNAEVIGGPAVWGSHGTPINLDGRLYSFTLKTDDVDLELQIVRTHDGYPEIHKGLPTNPASLNYEDMSDGAIPAAHGDMLASPDDPDQSNAPVIKTVNYQTGGGSGGGEEQEPAQQQSEEAAADFLAQVEALGGDKESVMIFGNEDDLIDGGDKDSIFAGGGNDLIVYDNSDFLIDGGSGIDILLANADAQYSLSDMLDNFNNKGGNEDMPMVNDVEILIKGVDMNNIQNLQDLHDKFGISLGKDANGNNNVTLDGSWHKVDGQNGSTSIIEHKNANGEVDATIETTMSFNDATVNDMAVLTATQQVQAETGN